MMCRMRLVLLLALSTLQISNVRCSPWWSIISGTGVFSKEDPTTPISMGCYQNGLDSILSDKQKKLCLAYGDTKLLPTIAIGVLQALNQCQKLFKDNQWNCSVFANSKKHYLGKFAETGTRETAFLNAIISAGISREIARKCKEQELSSCNCDFSVKGSTSGDSRNISGCGDNFQFGLFVAKQFTDANLNDNKTVTLAEIHNNKVGRLSVENHTSIKCVCHGVSGSCSVRTCFKNVPDIGEVGNELFKLYYVAKHVQEVGGELQPVDISEPPLIDEELAYLEFSPNFCERNLTYGIFGTSGRQCYPDRTDHSSCNSLCCGGQVVQRVKKLKEDRNACCEFVWCCYLDCSKCKTYKVTRYYCK